MFIYRMFKSNRVSGFNFNTTTRSLQLVTTFACGLAWLHRIFGFSAIRRIGRLGFIVQGRFSEINRESSRSVSMPWIGHMQTVIRSAECSHELTDDQRGRSWILLEVCFISLLRIATEESCVSSPVLRQLSLMHSDSWKCRNGLLNLPLFLNALCGLYEIFWNFVTSFLRYKVSWLVLVKFQRNSKMYSNSLDFVLCTVVSHGYYNCTEWFT